MHAGRTDRFARSDGLTGDLVLTLFEDREGNIWVGTIAGLEKFREFAVSTISSKQGLSGDYVWSVLASRDGNVWIGVQNALNLWRTGRISIFQKQAGLPDPAAQSMFEDPNGRLCAFTRRGLVSFEGGKVTLVSAVPGGQVHATAADSAGNLWLAVDRSLLHLRDGRVVEDVPWSRLGAQRAALTLLAGPEPGGLWVGSSLDSGIIYFKDGQIRQSYQARDGLPEGKIGSLSLSRDGALWAATVGGLSRISNGRITTLNSRNGLPCDMVHWSMVDGDDSFWLYTSCGLVRIARRELDAWTADPKRTIQTSVLDAADGVRLSTFTSGYTPRVSISLDGKIWFVTLDGVGVLDPRHIAVNKLAPPVHIESITADDKTYDLKPGMRLPANVRSLRIEYTALSFVAPEKSPLQV